MSHKEAKDGPPPGQAFQIVITLSQERGIEVNFPTNATLALTMIADAIKVIGQHSQFVAPSPIVQPPPGLRLTK